MTILANNHLGHRLSKDTREIFDKKSAEILRLISTQQGSRWTYAQLRQALLTQDNPNGGIESLRRITQRSGDALNTSQVAQTLTGAINWAVTLGVAGHGAAAEKYIERQNADENLRKQKKADEIEALINTAEGA